MKKQYELIGPLSEIKNCIYSPDGNFVCVSARNKTIWTWKKNLKNNFNFFFIIKDHDRDLKCLRWYPRHKYLITASYNGIIKFYQKNDKNNLPDSFHLNPFVMRGNVVATVFVDSNVVMRHRRVLRRKSERNRKWDDDESDGEKQDGVTHVTLQKIKCWNLQYTGCQGRGSPT